MGGKKEEQPKGALYRVSTPDEVAEWYYRENPGEAVRRIRSLEESNQGLLQLLQGISKAGGVAATHWKAEKDRADQLKAAEARRIQAQRIRAKKASPEGGAATQRKAQDWRSAVASLVRQFLADEQLKQRRPGRKQVRAYIVQRVEMDSALIEDAKKRGERWQDLDLGLTLPEVRKANGDPYKPRRIREAIDAALL